MLNKKKKKTSFQIIFAIGDFNWLKTRELNNNLSEKQPKIIKHLRHQKILFFLCVYING